EPLDDGDTAMLANRAKARSDIVPLAPAPVSLGGKELPSLVADQVSWCSACRRNGRSQENAQVDGSWYRAEQSKSECTTGVMVQDDRQPPAERPRLRQRERKPGTPEAHLRRDDRDVDMPDVIGPFCRHDLASAFGFIRGHRMLWFRLFPADPADGRG